MYKFKADKHIETVMRKMVMEQIGHIWKTEGADKMLHSLKQKLKMEICLSEI